MTNFLPRWDIKSERFFWRFSAVLFALLVIINYFPAFFGQVPLPGVLVTQFPAWGEFHSRHARPPVADIGDLIDQAYPWHAFSAQKVRSGTIPLWNPYVMSGYPFQAEAQTAMFYPFHALYYLFSTPSAWTIALILRAWLGCMFMTLLVRSLGVSKLGSIISGMAFGFSGFVVAWQGYAMGDAVIWLPLICYSVVRLRKDCSALSVSISAVAFAMPVLAGHPETAAHVTLTGVLAWLLIWIFPPSGARRFDPGFLLSFFAAGLLAIALASVQLLPTLQWIKESARDLNAIWSSFPLHQGLGFVSRDILRGPNSAGIFVPNSAAYVGMFTILAAAIGLLHPSRRYVIWFAALTVFGVAATFGLEPVHWVLTHLPVIKGLKNERLILLSDFGLAALAGLGVSTLERSLEQSSIKRKMAWLLIALSFSFAFVCIYILRMATQERVEFLRRPSFSRAMLLAGLIVVLWKVIWGGRAKSFPVIAVALVAFDLLTFAYGYTSFTPTDEVFPPAPVFEFLRQQGRTASFRFARAGGYAFSANSGLAYGIESVTGYEPMVPAALRRFTQDFDEGLEPSVSLIGEKILALKDRRIDMLNLKYLVVWAPSPEYPMYLRQPERFSEVFKRGDIAVFENKRVLPRAFLVGAAGIQVISDAEEQLRVLKEPAFDPERSVVLSETPRELAGGVTASAAADMKGRVTLMDSNPNGYRFRVEAPAPSVLIISQNLYPGWKAVVNGSSASVFAANHALTGIAVPAGNYEVAFIFDPLLFKVGAALSVMSALILVRLVTWKKRPVRK